LTGEINLYKGNQMMDPAMMAQMIQQQQQQIMQQQNMMATNSMMGSMYDQNVSR